MLYPTATELLNVCLRSLQTTIAPDVTGYNEKSIARTVGHLLRFGAQRIESEGQMLLDDIGALRALLPEVAAFLSTDADAVVESERIAKALQPVQRDPARYVTLSMLGAEVAALRAALYAAQKRLVALKPERGSQAQYQQIRQRIRQYVGWQLEQETRLVDAAFVGHGPRR